VIYHQGDVFFFELDPSKGTEPKKNRPCLIISNDEYNRHFNTVIVVPISSSKKYREQEKYLQSSFFMNINSETIDGTALLQHIRTIDPVKRRTSDRITSISDYEIASLKNVIDNCF